MSDKIIFLNTQTLDVIQVMHGDTSTENINSICKDEHFILDEITADNQGNTIVLVTKENTVR